MSRSQSSPWLDASAIGIAGSYSSRSRSPCFGSWCGSCGCCRALLLPDVVSLSLATVRVMKQDQHRQRKKENSVQNKTASCAQQPQHQRANARQSTSAKNWLLKTANSGAGGPGGGRGGFATGGQPSQRQQEQQLQLSQRQQEQQLQPSQRQQVQQLQPSQPVRASAPTSTPSTH